MFAALFFKLPWLPLAITQQACDETKHQFFFVIPPWWEFLNVAPDELGQCSPVVSFPHVILPVSLAIVDILVRIAGLVAIASVIIAGVGYMTAQGSVEKTVAARQRIYNALIGLAIVFIAAGVVAFIGNKLS